MVNTSTRTFIIIRGLFELVLCAMVVSFLSFNIISDKACWNKNKGKAPDQCINIYHKLLLGGVAFGSMFFTSSRVKEDLDILNNTNTNSVVNLEEVIKPTKTLDQGNIVTSTNIILAEVNLEEEPTTENPVEEPINQENNNDNKNIN